MSANITTSLYLVASICFILALRGLSSAKTARSGNWFAITGMGIAIGVSCLMPGVEHYGFIISGLMIGGLVGYGVAHTIRMTALPQLIAAFHSLVGLAAVFIAAAALYQPDAFGIGYEGDIRLASLIEICLGTIIGAITFTGSVMAFLKLQGWLPARPLIFSMQHVLNGLLALIIIGLAIYLSSSESYPIFWALVAASSLLGITLILPIGGADMPVIVSMLNSYSGWAAAGIGFTLENMLLIITGALVGSSGAILSYIMCKGMNRSIFQVVLGGFGNVASQGAAADQGERSLKAGSPEDAAFLLKNAQSVIIVPGYGMAVAQAQHALNDMAQALKKEGIKVRYAIHPVAGRMPGHMNVLLAEAKVPYEEVEELEDINHDFRNTDVAFVIGANDITNPAAYKDPSSPIYGMPILEVEKAKHVFFVKRSRAPGYAGVDNDLFYQENTWMLFGDAKKVCEDVLKALKD